MSSLATVTRRSHAKQVPDVTARPPGATIHPGTTATQPEPLASLLAYAEREAARRAKGTPAGTTRLHDGELAALLDVLRREVGATTASAPQLDGTLTG